MKHILLPIFALLLTVSCAKETTSPGEKDKPSSEKSALKTYITGSLDDIDAITDGGSTNTIDLYMALGETEHFQVKVFAKEDEALVFKSADKHPEIRFECRRFEDYGGYKDEVLVPCTGLMPGEDSSVKFWITVRTSAKAKPNSKYTESLVIESTNYRSAIKVIVHTGNVTIPAQSTIPTVFGIYTENAADPKSYSDFLLDYRISPYFFDGWGSDGHSINCTSAPFESGSTQFWEYVRDNRFSAVCLPFYNLSDEQLGTMIQDAKRYGIWDKCYYYLYDEPSTMAQFNAVKTHADRLHALDPDAKVMTTFYRGPQDGPRYGEDIMASFDYLDLGRSDIYCVVNDQEGVAAASYRSRLRDNQQWWSYVTSYNFPGISRKNNSWEQRAMMWRYYAEGSTGFLYWAVNWYESEDPLQARIGTNHIDGQIVFPGKAFGVGGICASIRLERFKDSLEDCEMLKIYEAEHSRNETMQLLGRIYGVPNKTSHSSAAIDSVHKVLSGNE